jgi:hypothetical protein
MLLTLLGFPWAIALWAPVALVRLSHRIYVFYRPLTRESQQLAEAIHTTPDTDVGEPDIDDNQSILLADTSTHHLSQQNEELFAVEGSDSDEEAAARGEREREDSDDGNDHVSERDGDRQGLMGNTHARRSWVDLADIGENPVQNGGARPGRGNLSSKTGLILVRRPLVPQLFKGVSHLFFISARMCALLRGYKTSSSSFRSFSSRP